MPPAASWDNSRSAEKQPVQSARGLAHSKTLRSVCWSSLNAPAFWSAVALNRFSSRTKHARNFKRPLPAFVHPKLPLAGACARPPIGTLLGSAPVPAAVFGIAPVARHFQNDTLPGQGFAKTILHSRHPLNFIPQGNITRADRESV
jgi:hypothetical protein